MTLDSERILSNFNFNFNMKYFALQDREPSSRFGRSPSPPIPPKRFTNWKTTADEDALFRTEVLLSQIPLGIDEWMVYEMKALSEFTRIFPPEEKIRDLEDVNGGDDENDGKKIHIMIVCYNTCDIVILYFFFMIIASFVFSISFSAIIVSSLVQQYER